MKKAGRLMAMIYMLRSRPHKSSELAVNLGITERTVFRDLNEIQEALADVAPVVCTARGYSLDKTLYAPPLHFLAEESAALAHAVEALAPVQHPHYPLARQALSKIEAHLQARPRSESADLRISAMGQRDRVPAKRLQELEYWLAKKVALELDYFSHNSGREKKILFCPYALVFRKQVWYLIGHAPDKNHLILLRAFRIRGITPTAMPVEIPPDFSVANYFRDHWEVFDGRPEAVQLRFSGPAAWRVQEMIWHQSQRLVANANSVDLHLQVPVTPEFIAWVLGWGHHCEALAPERLRAQIQTEISGLRARYGG
jgi:predicted DNA-binding transcriptional regulator YafY